MDILEPERLEASPLKAAARRLTFGPRPAAESPDDTDLLPTVPVPADDAGDNGRPNEPDSPALADMRRDLDAITAQLTQVTNIAALLDALLDAPAKHRSGGYNKLTSGNGSVTDVLKGDELKATPVTLPLPDVNLL